MISIGIDVGRQACKVVAFEDGKVRGYVVAPLEQQSAEKVANYALNEVIASTHLAESEIGSIVVTGAEAGEVGFATAQAREFLCLAKGVNWVLPSTRTVLDIGAQKCLAVRCAKGVPLKVAENDKCAAGAGKYLEMVAELLRMRLEDTEELLSQAKEEVEVSSTCAVFAESEIISLIHSKKDRPSILKGALKALAARIYSVLLRASPERDIAIVGGLATNKGVVKCLKEVIGYEILIPDNPQIIGALGAALIGEERGNSL